MEITDATLIAMSSVLIVGSSIVILVVNYRRCKKQPPVQPEAVETVMTWK